MAAVVAALGFVASERPANAQNTPRVAELLPKLQAASDPRVRGATVLQFGATNDDAAVEPLCRELSHEAEIVRFSAASAIRRLGRPASLDCLKKRLAIESADGPKLAMTRAIAAIEAAPPASAGPSAGAYTPPEHAGAKFYVVLSPVTTTAERPQAEVEAVVLRAIRQNLEGVAEVQMAPPKESDESAKRSIASRKAKGFYLSISVDKFDYSGGNLRVKVNIAIFSYPNKSLIAPSSKSASMAGVSPGSRSAEDQLLEAVAVGAVKQFTANASAM